MRLFFDFYLSIVILNVLLPSESLNATLFGATPEQKRKGLFISKKSDITSLMQTLGSSFPHHIRLLYCPENQDKLADVTSQLSDDLIGLMTQSYDGAETDLVPMLSPLPHEISLHLFTFCSPGKVLDIFRKINNQFLDSHKVRWLIVIEDVEEITQFTYELERLVYEGTQVTILDKKSNHAYDVLWERVDPQGNINFFNEGRWDIRNNFLMDQISNHLAYDNSRGLHYDLSGRRMTLAAKELSAYLVFGKVYPDRRVEPASGMEFEILKCMMSTFNFTYQMVTPEDKLYGNPQPDGSVNGMIGMVVRREVSFVLSCLGITEAREKVLDFSSSYTGGSMTLISRAPQQKSRAMAVLYPFSFKVWIAIAISVLFMGCCISVQSNLLQLGGFENAEKSGFESQLFNVYRSIVVQGYRLNDQYWATRYLLFSWFVFCLIISALYSGMLTAVLALPSYETPINSLHDLPKAVKDGFTLGVLKETTHEHVFKSATDGIYKQTWELFNHENPSESFVDSNAIGFEQVLERKFVFVATDIVAEVGSTRLGRKNFYFGREKFHKLDVGIACQRGSPYVERLSIVLLRLCEGGLPIKWMNQELRILDKLSRNSSYENISSNHLAFSLAHLQAAFIVMVLGFLVAALIFLSEKMIHYELHHHETSSIIKEMSIFCNF